MDKEMYYALLQGMYHENLAKSCEALGKGDSEKRKYYEDRSYVLYDCLQKVKKEINSDSER